MDDQSLLYGDLGTVTDEEAAGARRVALQSVTRESRDIADYDYYYKISTAAAPSLSNTEVNG